MDRKVKANERIGPMRGWVRTVLQALAIGVGAAVGQYAGVMLLIPVVSAGIVWWLGRKLLPADRQVVLVVLALGAGHCLWLVLGLVVRGGIGAAFVDVVLYAIALGWLVVRPGVRPLYLLGIYQAVALVNNAVALVDAAVGSAAHKALLVHVLWLLATLVAIGRLWVRIRPRKEATT